MRIWSESNDSSVLAPSSNPYHAVPDPGDNVSLASKSAESETEPETYDLISLGSHNQSGKAVASKSAESETEPGTYDLSSLGMKK